MNKPKDMMSANAWKLRSMVLPYCVYHWVNKESGTYRAFLSNAQLEKREDGTESFRCWQPPLPTGYGYWKLAGVFYAVNPMFRPIPFGMQLFCAERRKEWPFDTVSVNVVYDPFHTSPSCVYFITFTHPVPYIVPLYLHTLNDRVFPDFDPKSPPFVDDTVPLPGLRQPSDVGAIEAIGSRKERILQIYDIHTTGGKNMWASSQVSPIYVMTPEVFGDKYNEIGFVCNNGTCFPWHKKIEDVFRATPLSPPKPLHECVTDCNILVLSEEGGGRPFALLDLIRQDVKQEEGTPVVPKFFREVPSAVVGIIIAVLIISMAIVLYITLKKK